MTFDCNNKFELDFYNLDTESENESDNESEDENQENDIFGQKRKKQETLLDNNEWQSKFYDSLIGAEGGSDDFIY